MKYLSVCSGIEAASVAWHPLGWQPLAFSEIEPFPRAVLAHHYPDTPLHGDFTVLRDQPWIEDADILVGGTPCQAFSVAGLRNSLADDRGNLSLEYVRLADAIDNFRLAAGRQPAVIVWENVPGVLSVKDNAFGCFLAALAGDASPYVPPRGKWTDAGVVDGPQRAVAWRILDAQYFGLAQRRRRVFVVASAREGFDPAAVLLEFEGMRRDTPPRREAGQGFAHATAPCLTSSGRGVEHTGETRGQDPVVAVPSTGDISHCLNAGGMGRQDYETETLIAHTLKGEGFDASEDGTGRGTPLVPVISDAVGFYANEGSQGSGNNAEMSPTLKAHPKTSNLAAVAYRTTGNDGVYETGDLVHALTTATDPNSHVITFSFKDHGGDATVELSPTLRALGAYDANGGGQMAVAHAIPFDTTQITSPSNYSKPKEDDPCHPLAAGAHPPAVAYAFQPRIARNGRGDMGDVVNALNAQSGETGKGDAAPCVAISDPVPPLMARSSRGGAQTLSPGHQTDGHMVAQHMAVRRLTPVECERLQGFPDNYTMIPWKKKPADVCPDGPRYKALGNSMAVPCMRWIGKRIANEIAEIPA